MIEKVMNAYKDWFKVGGAKFEPRDGKCYTGAGQSLLSIIEMSASIDSNHQPVLVALYEGIYRDSGEFKMNTHAGISEMHNILPGAILQIGYQLCIQDMEGLEELANGVADDIILETAKRYKHVELPIFLRPGYEFSGVWNGYDPAIYKRAYRHFVDVFHREGVRNVAYIWNSHNAYQYNMFDWFPCDDGEIKRYVDWFSYNILNDKFDASWYMDAVDKYQCPVMIGESSYAIAGEDYTFEDWCNDFFSAIKKHGVKGYQYINWDWHVYPQIMQWNSWKNGRYTKNETDTKAYNQKLIDDESYIFRDSSFYMPVRMYVDCGRGLKEDDLITDWSKDADHAWSCEGYAYEVHNALAEYGDGFKPYWVSQQQNIKIKLTVNCSEDINVLLWLESEGSANGWYRVVINNIKEYEVHTVSDNFVKIPILSNDIQGNQVSIQISCDKGKVQLIEMGVLGFAENAPCVMYICKETTENEIIFSWTELDDAYVYNIYKDYQLVDMVSQSQYTVALELYKNSVYCISATSIYNGEGQTIKI